MMTGPLYYAPLTPATPLFHATGLPPLPPTLSTSVPSTCYAPYTRGPILYPTLSPIMAPCTRMLHYAAPELNNPFRLLLSPSTLCSPSTMHTTLDYALALYICKMPSHAVPPLCITPDPPPPSHSPPLDKRKGVCWWVSSWEPLFQNQPRGANMESIALPIHA